MKIKRKVVVIFGKFGKNSDFVIEPVFPELDKKGYYEKENFYTFEIEGEEEK